MYEVKPWKQPGCELSLKTAKLSQREPWSYEINGEYGGGGALHANYQTVDAICVVVDALASAQIRFNVDFVFKTGGSDTIIFDFKDKETARAAESVLTKALRAS